MYICTYVCACICVHAVRCVCTCAVCDKLALMCVCMHVYVYMRTVKSVFAPLTTDGRCEHGQPPH